jgi:hypothetical protein
MSEQMTDMYCSCGERISQKAYDFCLKARGSGHVEFWPPKCQTCIHDKLARIRLDSIRIAPIQSTSKRFRYDEVRDIISDSNGTFTRANLSLIFGITTDSISLLVKNGYLEKTSGLPVNHCFIPKSSVNKLVVGLMEGSVNPAELEFLSKSDRGRLEASKVMLFKLFQDGAFS